MTNLSKIFLAVSLLIWSSASATANDVHLLGFVEQLCTDKAYCFKLRVEAVYSGEVTEDVIVLYDTESTIFDPENYQLTLAQSNIVEGSHLRLLLAPGTKGYRAEVIWIGD